MAKSANTSDVDEELLHCKEHNKKVRALCRSHKQFLCTDCFIQNKHPDNDCNLTDMEDLKDERSKLFKELVRLNDHVLNTEKEYDEADRAIDDKKDELDRDINEFYNKLDNKLKELRQTTLKSVDDQTKECKQVLYDKRNQLKEAKEYAAKQLDDFEKVSQQDTSTVVAEEHFLVLRQLDISTEDIEAAFRPETKLLKVLESHTLLGKVSVFMQQHYEPMDPSKQTKQELYSGCDYQKSDSDHSDHADKSYNEEELSTTHCPTGSQKTPFSEKPQIPERQIHKKKCLKEACVPTRPAPEVSAISRMKNKTITLSNITHKKALIASIVMVDPSNLALIDQKHGEVFFADIGGEILSKRKIMGNVLGMTAYEFPYIAVLHSHNKSVKLTLFSNGNADDSEYEHAFTDDTINNIQRKLTGFDFDSKSKQFAISGDGKLLIVKIDQDKSLAKVCLTKSCSEKETTSATDFSCIKTTYDFRNKCMYILNIKGKSVKCFNVDTLESVWKKRCLDADFIPREICQFGDKLAILCKGQIAMFCKDGSAAANVPTAKILPDSYAIFVVQDQRMAIISSKSEKNTLAFIEI